MAITQKMLNEIQNQGEGGTKKNSDQQTTKAVAPETMEKPATASGDELDDVEDLGEPVVKGDEDSGPFEADDTVDGPAKRKGDKDNDEPIKDMSKSKMVTKAYESLHKLDKATLKERLDAILAAIDGVRLDEEAVDLTEEVDSLLGSEKDLSEEFKKKATTILETKFSQLVKEEKARLNELYESQLQEEVERIEEEITEKLDSYLEYAAGEWMKENQLAVDAGIKNEIAESFMSGLYDLLASHSLHVPEEQEDVVTKLSARAKELEEQNNKAIDTILEMRTSLRSLIKEKVINTVCEDLTAIEKSKIVDLSEDLSFDSQSDLMEKVSTLREHYFPTDSDENARRGDSSLLSEEMLSSQQSEIDEENSKKAQPILSSDPNINRLAEAMGRFGINNS